MSAGPKVLVRYLPVGSGGRQSAVYVFDYGSKHATLELSVDAPQGDAATNTPGIEFLRQELRGLVDRLTAALNAEDGIEWR